MELKGYYNERTLDELLQEGKICRLEYIYHHSAEMRRDFSDFCLKESLQQNDKAAEAFHESRLRQKEKSNSTEPDMISGA